MESDTQKTTKAVRKAPTASQNRCNGSGVIWKSPKLESLGMIDCPGCIGCQPRYTVELTTEGWQIKDNVKGTIGAEFWTSSHEPEGVCNRLNRGEKV